MDKKQRNMFGTILIFFIIIALIIGYTFAKYDSSYNGSGQVGIAKWSFKVDGWSTSETKQLYIWDLLNHEDKVSLENGKIAPGFDGTVELELDATDSEVDVKYYFEATETGHKPSNLYFYAEVDGEATGIQETLHELAEKELTGTILKGDSSKVRNIVIHCVWPYETGTDEASIILEDEEDTAAGTGTVEGQENVFDYSFSLKVIGTQAKATD